MHNPRLLLPAAMLMTLLLMAGCGGGGGGGQGSGDGGGGAEGKNLVVGYDQEPAILNNYVVGGDLVATIDTTAGILQAPIEANPDLEFSPELAEEVPTVVSEDPLVIEYKLKEGLKWSDGKPLTSADARFTYEQIMNPDNQIITRLGWENVEKFETPDERTVRITFTRPYAPWRALMTDQILPKHVYEGKDFNKDLNNEVVGSGPFKLKEWKKGESLTWERNPNYWGKKPALDTVTFRFIPDTNSLTAALQSGEVGFITPPPDLGLIEKLEGIEGAKVDTKYGTEWEHIAFNVEKVDNLKLRQAIAYGIDRKQIIDEVLPGQARELNSVVVPEQEEYYTPAWEGYQIDQDRARQLVEEAKAEGAQTTIEFSTTSGNKLRETLQQIVQKQLGDIGIDVKVNNSAPEVFFGERTPAGDFEMGDWAWAASPDPELATLFSANSIPPDGQNNYRYKNDEVTRLLEQSEETVDVAERADLVKQASEIMAEDLPLVPLYQRPNIYAYSESLKGPNNNPTEAGPFWNVEEWSIGQ